MAEVVLDLHIAALIAFAGGNGRLDSHGMTERAEERLQLRDGPIVCLRSSTHRWTTLDVIRLVTKVMLTTGAERAGVMDEDGYGRSKRRANEGLPEVEGPVLAVGGDLGKETDGGVVEVTGLGVLGLRLEDLHFAPEGRVVSNGAILLRGLELLLLAGTVLKVERAERDEGGVVLYKLACETTLGRQGRDDLNCAGGLRVGRELVKLR